MIMEPHRNLLNLILDAHLVQKKKGRLRQRDLLSLPVLLMHFFNFISLSSLSLKMLSDESDGPITISTFTWLVAWQMLPEI